MWLSHDDEKDFVLRLSVQILGNDGRVILFFGDSSRNPTYTNHCAEASHFYRRPSNPIHCLLNNLKPMNGDFSNCFKERTQNSWEKNLEKLNCTHLQLLDNICDRRVTIAVLGWFDELKFFRGLLRIYWTLRLRWIHWIMGFAKKVRDHNAPLTAFRE